MAVAGLVSANVGVWAQSRGWDQWLLRFANAIPSWLQDMIAGWPALRQRWWLWLGMGLSGGLALVSWLLPPLETSAATPAATQRSSKPMFGSINLPIT